MNRNSLNRAPRSDHARRIGLDQHVRVDGAGTDGRQRWLGLTALAEADRRSHMLSALEGAALARRGRTPNHASCSFITWRSHETRAFPASPFASASVSRHFAPRAGGIQVRSAAAHASRCHGLRPGAKVVCITAALHHAHTGIYGLQMNDYVRFVGDEPNAPAAPGAQATRGSVAGVARPSR